MWKKILVALGGVVLAISLPLAVLAIATDQTPTPNASTSAAADVAQPADLPDNPSQVQEQPMVRQRLRVHAETGPPEGFEPVRQRRHEDEAGVRGRGALEMSQRNPNGSMGGCAGECTDDGAPSGRAQGRGGQGRQRTG